MTSQNQSSAVATALPIDPFRINTETTQPTEEEKKKRGRPPTKDRIEEQEIARKKQEERDAFRFTNQLIASKIAGEGDDKNKGKAKEVDPPPKNRADEGVKIYRKICAYHSTFSYIFHDFKVPPPNSPIHVLQSALTEMRSRMATERADLLIRNSIPKAAKVMEFIVHDIGMNPQGWTLRTPSTSFSKELEKEEVMELLEPELSEAIIECRDYLSAPWYLRLAFRVGILADAFSAQHAMPSAPPASGPRSDDL